MEKKQNNILLYSILGGVITCFICVGMIFLFPSKGTSKLKSNNPSMLNQGEISVGDSNCQVTSGPVTVYDYDGGYVTVTSCSAQTFSGTCYEKGSTVDTSLCGSDDSQDCYAYRKYTISCTTEEKSCDSGHYVSGDECKACPPGTAKEGKSTATSCPKCTGNTYTSNYGAYHCIQAPQNSTVNSAKTDFTCNDGYERSGNECKKITCTGEKILNQAGTGCVCPDGKVESSDGARCNLHCNNTEIVVDGKCTSSQNEDITILCPFGFIYYNESVTCTISSKTSQVVQITGVTSSNTNAIVIASVGSSTFTAKAVGEGMSYVTVNVNSKRYVVSLEGYAQDTGSHITKINGITGPDTIDIGDDKISRSYEANVEYSGERKTDYVNWSSSDTSIATVSNGDYDNETTVNPLKAGTITITAKAVSNPSITATKTITITDSGSISDEACYCNPINSRCEWRNTNANSWIEMTNITTQTQCTNYSTAGSNGCFKGSDGKFVWGDYGAKSGYTYTVAADKASCEEKNKSGDKDTYVLRCPSTTIVVGESIVCTYEASNDSPIAGVSINPTGFFTANGSGNQVTINAIAVGTGTVKVTSKAGGSTNGVTITVLENDYSEKNCKITEVKVDQPVVSLNEEDNRPANSYYIVHVSFMGLGCSKNTLTVTSNNGTVSPAGAQEIKSSERTGQYSFHVYPTMCKPSSPTATLSNGDTKIGSSVTVMGDWQKSTGCYTPCGNSRCTNKEVYDSFLEADLDNSATGPYYNDWDANKKCYGTMWTRKGCGGGTSNPTPTPVPSTYTYCCIKSDKSDYKWYTNQSSPTCPSGYTIDYTRTKDSCAPETVEKIPYCYADEDDNYHWTSNPQTNWKIVVGISNETNCKKVEDEACYLTPSNEYVWGKYATKDGYKLITAIKAKEKCVTPKEDEACYKNDNDEYVWGNEAPEGYTKVEGINNPTACKKEENPACYVHGNEYLWGKYDNIMGYIKLNDETKEGCKKPETAACYISPSGEYVWGKYGVDPEYKLVPSIKEETLCKNDVPVPSTASNVSKLVYVFMAVLMACGIGFIYYSTVLNKRKQ